METKSALRSVAKYLRELSIVVLGIVITFGVSSWISARNEKQDIQRYLDAVRLELDDNLLSMRNEFDYYDRAEKLAKYLRSDIPERLKMEDIAKYDDVVRNAHFIVFKTSAFEMLKSSGMMRLIKDKGLSKSIIDCYVYMDGVKSFGNDHMKDKSALLRDALLAHGYFDDLRDPRYRRLLYYFSNSSRIDEGVQGGIKLIEKTLTLLKEAE